MVDYKKFEEKVKSMTAHDIIMAMVEGLRNPKTEIEMGTFGEMRRVLHFGGTTTNAVLYIMEANEEKVKAYYKYRSFYDAPLLWRFEGAIDRLRRGQLELYNEYAAHLGFAQITPIPGQELPYLSNNFTEKQLKEYEKLAKYQLTIKTNNND